jgi:glycerate 2-kinase
MKVQSESIKKLKQVATEIFMAGVHSVDPEICVPAHLRLNNNWLIIGKKEYPMGQFENLYLVGMGKASAAMAKAVESILGDRIKDGLIITKYDHEVPLKRCQVMTAGHPMPDANGVKATMALLDMVKTATANDLILCMISGGGSALSPAPVLGIDLNDKQEITRQLLSCGATIHEINTIRKHLSRIKGGRLCQAANGASVVSLILSDVIGGRLGYYRFWHHGSGPSSFGDCMEILEKYGLTESCPQSVKKYFTEGCKGKVGETPSRGGTLRQGLQPYHR